MATIAVAKDFDDEHTIVYKWETITTTNRDGAAIEIPDHVDRSIQAIGTFSAGTPLLSLEGSNDGGTTWAILTDPQGVAITLTAVGLKQISEVTRHIRPNLAGGDGSTDIDVFVLVRHPRQ